MEEKMQAREIMTENPTCCTPNDTVQDAARKMIDMDCGCLPVVSDMESKAIIGVVTDRDLACRCLGEGKGPDTRVSEVMSANPSCCTPDSEVEEVERVMTERQVRRVPVIDDQGCCVGVIAQADLARAKQAVGNREVGRVVERVSQPTGQPRADAAAGIRPTG
jgi:CBS domain-containing protein